MTKVKVGLKVKITVGYMKVPLLPWPFKFDRVNAYMPLSLLLLQP
jgi:hypothetical protein